MVILLCLRIIEQTLGMAELELSIRILFQSLSAKDLSFEESIVVKLKFARKSIFFTVLYRTTAFNHTSPEFQAFLINFENLYSKIKTEIPFAIFVTGDFNVHS